MSLPWKFDPRTPTSCRSKISFPLAEGCDGRSASLMPKAAMDLPDAAIGDSLRSKDSSRSLVECQKSGNRRELIVGRSTCFVPQQLFAQQTLFRLRESCNRARECGDAYAGQRTHNATGNARKTTHFKLMALRLRLALRRRTTATVFPRAGFYSLRKRLAAGREVACVDSR
jgi:hypothetical protein